MEKWSNIQKLVESGLVVVVRRPPQEKVNSIAEALIAGGVGALEITVDTPGVFQMIASLKDSYGGNVLIGAGTVLDAETAKRAIEAGADFIFSPNFDPETVRMTNKYGKISIPGVMTPTEIVQAYEAGADLLKIFPADTLGPDYIKSLRGPLGHIPMMPTGGVSLENVEQYIRSGAVAVGVGGTILDREAINQGRFSVLTERAKQFSNSIQKARS